MRRRDRTPVPHRHYLYTAAVQSVEADIAFFRRVYRKERGRSFRRLREDFCGTAVLAHDWVRRGSDHHAWGVDLDRETLAWGRARYGPRLGRAARRLHLICRDVLDVHEPAVDVVAALNFSYFVFRTRDALRRYFRQVRRSLARGGMLFLDAWGGTEAMSEEVERRRVAASTAFDGTKLPAFTYVWEQELFNPIDHAMRCHIHFELRGGRRLRRAFSYPWRLWTLPELRELLLEAGFAAAQVYVEGWDEEADEADGIFRRRRYFENQAGWVAYVVGLR
jgi:SAM-dependent methyltransferase